MAYTALLPLEEQARIAWGFLGTNDIDTTCIIYRVTEEELIMYVNDRRVLEYVELHYREPMAELMRLRDKKLEGTNVSQKLILD